MIDDVAWQQRNQTYLGAALAWLRLRMDMRLARPMVAGDGEAPQAAEQPGFNLASLWRRAEQEPPSLPPAPRTLLIAPENARALDEAAATLTEASEGEPKPALLDLAHRLELTAFERDVLLLAVAREIEPALTAAYDRTPSFALAMTLFDDPVWDAMSPDRPLRYWELVRFDAADAGTARVAAPIFADERVVNYVKGLFHLDARIAPWVTRAPAPPKNALFASQKQAVDALTTLAASGAVAIVTGADTPSKRNVAGAAAAAAGRDLYRLSTDTLSGDAERTNQLARLWHREALLAPLGLMIEAEDTSDTATLRRFVSQTGGFVLVSAREAIALDLGAVPTIPVALPTAAEQKAAWQQALGAKRAPLAARLADQFALGGGAIATIAASAAGGHDAQVWDASRRRARPVIAELAQRVDAKATLADLVLPDAEKALIEGIIAQVGNRGRVYDDWGFRGRMNRGFGITALFAGPSGTGKTMAAEVVANALSLDLYRIDLAAVISKYIGETEKQLRSVFDAVEGAGAVLLFDEADALFGKRSEVKDSHDRYANIEINYLLQRLESYSGVAILATNRRTALDSAFTRRLRFIVNFPYPAIDERRRIWENALPAGAPTETLDFARLAQLDLTGGDIHAVALGASFAAAAAGSPITMKLIFDAARREFRKLDRPVNEADFRTLHLTRRGR